MVLANYGHPISESELRSLLKTRPGGTSPARLILRLPELGFQASVQTGSEPFLVQQVRAGRPCIIYVWTPHLPHWDDEALHALVVSHISENSVQVHDPILPTGPTLISRAALMHAWAATGYVIIVIQPIGTV